MKRVTIPRFTKIVVSICLMLGLGLFCLPCVAVRADTPPEIVVGGTISEQGRFRAPSRMMALAYRLWERQVNRDGGLLGRPVRLVLLDDRSDADLVGRQYQTLIDDYKVDLVLSPFSTTLTHAASKVTEKRGFVMLAAAAAGEVVWDRGYRYVFGVTGTAGRYFIGFLDLAARNGLKSVAILHEDDMFPKEAAQGALSWAQRMAIDVRGFQNIDGSAAGVEKSVADLVRSKPDAVILCAYPPVSYDFLKAAAAANYSPRALAMTVVAGLPDFPERAGKAVNGIFCPSYWEPDERVPFPGAIGFIRSFKQFTGIDPTYHAGAAFASCQLLQHAVNKTGNLDQERLRDVIATLETVTVVGRFKVSAQGRQVGHNLLLVQWQGGVKQIVHPIKMRTAEPAFKQPLPPEPEAP